MLGVTNGSGDVAGSYDPGGLWTPNSARKDVKTKGQSPQAQDNLQVVVATPKATMGPSHYISTLTNVVHVPFHHPQEMQQLMTQAHIANEREKSFPVKLYTQRVTSDKATTEMVSNYTELIEMLESDLVDVEKVDFPTASSMREVVDLLKAQFEQFRNFNLQSESTTSKNFAEYKDVLQQQFGAVMALELANLHNGLSVWRHNVVQQQVGIQMDLKQSVATDADEGRYMMDELRKDLNKLTLRHGLLATEKKTSEQKVIGFEKELGDLMSQHQKLRDVSKMHLQDSARIIGKKDEQLTTMKEAETKLLAEVKALKEKFNKHSERMMSEKNATLATKELSIKDLRAKNRELESRLKETAAVTTELRSAEAAYISLKSSTDTQVLVFQRLISEKNSQLCNKAEAEKKLLDKLKLVKDQASKDAALLKGMRVAKIEDVDKLLEKIHVLEAKQRVQAETSKQEQKENSDLLKQITAMRTELGQEKANAVHYLCEKTELEIKCLDLKEQKSALEQKLSKAKGAQDIEQKLGGEQQKLGGQQHNAQNLKAENARLIFQLTTDKAASDVEKKHLWKQVNTEKAETARLEQEVFRLASKFMIAERQVDELCRGDDKVRENFSPFAAPKSSRVEEPGSIIYRHAPFEYTRVPRPLDPVPAPDKRRVEVLEQQLKIYQALLDQDNINNFRGLSRVQELLMESGLHKDHPAKGYVNPQYYSYVEHVRGQAALSAPCRPFKPQDPSGLFELDNLEMIDGEDLF